MRASERPWMVARTPAQIREHYHYVVERWRCAAARPEWLWRLLQEPRRLWRRYLIEDLGFMPLLLEEWWRKKANNDPR